MRKIYIIIFLLSLQFALSAQWYGDGSEGDAFWGVINSSYPLDTELEWNTDNFPGGVIYVGQSGSGENDLVIGSGFTLTIGPGITVILTQLTSDLIITGSGILTAEGTSSNQIIFTKASGNSHWGHISFETPGSGTPIAGTGTFDYCIIEYGYAATSGTYPSNAGGGIQVNANDVTIVNCLIEDNYSNFGGAVTVNAGRNTEIKNCVFKSNTSNQAGGALLLWTSSTAKVENCIFEENNSLSNGGTAYGGGGIWILANTSTIVNCTFVNNTATDPGDAIYSYSSSGSRIINCILWGSDDQFAGASTTSTIVTCAFETSKPATALTSIIISNVADDHFTDAGSGDWSLKFISPCRDAGTNSYGSPNIVPSLDYDGNPRIGTKDIGTYEVQYSRWTGATSTDWTTATNWDQNVYPSSGTGDVIIPSGLTNYPDETDPVTIGTGNYLIINPKAQATFGTINNNSTGTLWLKSDSFGINDSIASLKVDTYNPYSGTTKIELYLQGNSTMWHYISPPIASLTATTFSSASAAVAEYQEDRIEDDMNNGWVTSTGYHYDVTTEDWEDEGWTWSNLLVGKAYNYYSATSKKFDINGTINTDDVAVDLYYNSGSFTPDYPNAQGYNLIGNPYTCSLDWDLVVEDDANYPSVWYDAEATIYFRKNGLTYYYNYGSGETVPDDYNADGNLIPPMQGFFIKTNDYVELTIPADAKTHSSSKRYKGIKNVPKIRLQFENTEAADQTLIWFSEKATLSFDNLCDSRKLFLDDDNPYVYTSLAGIKYAINGINFPENSVSIPLVVNANNAGLYTIKATQITDLDNYTIYLKDNILDNTVNLSEVSQYSFSTPSGLLSDRFTIIISDIATTIPENTISNKPFNIYSSGKQINIHTLSDNWNGKQGDVKIMDLTGKTVSLQRNVSFSKDEIKQIDMYSPYGIYFVEIRSGVLRYVGKVVIR